MEQTLHACMMACRSMMMAELMLLLMLALELLKMSKITPAN